MEAIEYLAILFAVLVFLCVFTNLIIVIATIRSKKLHTSCNILIAICAFSDIIHLQGQLPKIIPIFRGTVEISSYECCLLQIIPNFGFSTGVIIILLIAIDRFIAVYFQQYYLVKDSRRYLMYHCLVIVAYAAFHYAIAYVYFENQSVICSPPEMYHGYAKKLWGTTSFLIIALAIVIYCAVWQKLRHTGTFSEDRRIFRTIFAVMCVIILGWFLSMIIFNCIGLFNLEGHDLYAAVDVSGIPVNTAVSFNSLVLYCTSKDYRSAFQEQFRLIPCIGRYFPPEKPLHLSTVVDSYDASESSTRHSVSHVGVGMPVKY